MTQGDHTTALMLAGALLDPVIAVSATDPRAAHQAYDDELAALPGAVPKRLREFSAGRVAARQAMAELGAPPLAVLMGQDRAPIWPDPLLGTISHTDTACLAAVAWVGEVRMLALDIEEDAALPEDLTATVCTPIEQTWLARQTDPGRAAKVIFSAKECAYKAQYPASQTLFDFQTLEVTMDETLSSFVARFAHPVAPFGKGDEIPGKIARGDGLIVTAVAVRA
ncbi:4'-phosphopantetheinyl transferase Npt [Falsiruegeria litorea R37]|uniref:Enterobactin synthase component D n=1 Tax=Falsiruegeria litorea R37 TaxID=1200284 RepID=A0A1Y5T5Y7_9RHOB|nr:4'-phosphopantetheinyl transferase superfamily protein [Falsiruegeria litorea]SLN53272.1 4'-phosphopantetheinyl transferase Npt [Falsiruegeria litorea R37]